MRPNRNEYRRIWIKEHPGYSKKWVEEHPESRERTVKKYSLSHKEQRNKNSTEWNKEHIERVRETQRIWWKSPNGKLSEKKYRASLKGKIVRKRRMNKRYRELGFVPLNEWEFGKDGFEGHHLDREHVLYIPKELHEATRHDVFSGKNMDIINEKAINWYIDYYGLI